MSISTDILDDVMTWLMEKRPDLAYEYTYSMRDDGGRVYHPRRFYCIVLIKFMDAEIKLWHDYGINRIPISNPNAYDVVLNAIDKIFPKE